MTTNPETAGVEPVAVIGKDWSLLWASADTLKAIVDRTGITIGTPLYAHPPATRENGEAEIARLRGLLVDPGTPPWEDMRAVLVAELDKAGLSERAAILAEAGATDIPSWMALNLMATITLATTRPAPEQALECPHSRTTMHETGDGVPVEFCPECGTNIAIDGRPLAPDHANCAVGEGEPTPEPTPQQGSGEELVERIKAAMGYWTNGEKNHRGQYQILLNGLHREYVTTNDNVHDRVKDYNARAALAAMPTPAAIRAETTAQIVAWLRAGAWFGHHIGPASTANFNRMADAIERGDHLTGGGE